jgi:site-specific DNA-methyltransferase (adenine-specific)
MKKIVNDLMGYTLINEDCLAGLKQIETESGDVILTDPPFSSGGREASKSVRKAMNRAPTAEATWFAGDNMSVNGFKYLMRECALEWNRILKPGSHIFVFIDHRMMAHLSAAIEAADLLYRGVLVWDKTYFGMGSHFRNQHEFILHFSKSNPTKPLVRNVANVLSFKPIRNGVHLTQKPVGLLQKLLSVVAPPGSHVVDCFNGSGSSGVASLLSGCVYTGIEREEKNILISKSRLDNFFDELQAPTIKQESTK